VAYDVEAYEFWKYPLAPNSVDALTRAENNALPVTSIIFPDEVVADAPTINTCEAVVGYRARLSVVVAHSPDEPPEVASAPHAGRPEVTLSTCPAEPIPSLVRTPFAFTYKISPAVCPVKARLVTVALVRVAFVAIKFVALLVDAYVVEAYRLVNCDVPVALIFVAFTVPPFTVAILPVVTFSVITFEVEALVVVAYRLWKYPLVAFAVTALDVVAYVVEAYKFWKYPALANRVENQPDTILSTLAARLPVTVRLDAVVDPIVDDPVVTRLVTLAVEMFEVEA
jgi:hypothetical protein